MVQREFPNEPLQRGVCTLQRRSMASCAARRQALGDHPHRVPGCMLRGHVTLRRRLSVVDSIIVAATLDSLSSIKKYVLEAAQEARLEPKAICRLLLAVDEIMTHAIMHGQAGAEG